MKREAQSGTQATTLGNGKARLRYLYVLLSALGACISVQAWAIDTSNLSASKKQPVMLTADRIGYDEKTATAVAQGHVEVVQGETIVMADRVTYNQNTDMVHAVGHVSVLEPTGDVLFSEDTTLKQSLEKGVVKQFQARLKDNSLFAAREAEKINKNVTKLHDVVYSPCNICAPKPGEAASAPMWQMAAETVTIDEEAQKVRYRNAFMDLYGVPVLYTPYFSHPTPDAPSESGLLMPQYYHSSTLGNVVKQPVYISIAPNMDMTLTPWYLSAEKPLIQGEFRHMTEAGSYEMSGAVTDAYNLDSLGNRIPGTELRYYIDAHGKFKINDIWNAGADLERTSDNTFLALYGLGWQDMLTSRLYTERLKDRDYFLVEGLAFQGLQPQDIANQSPYILPHSSLHVESEPLAAHSRVALDGDALVLERQTGDSDQRISGTVSWKLPYITHDGQVIEAKASLRGDNYNVINQTVNPTTGSTFSGDTGRVIPELDLDWRYPFINRFGEGRSLMVAPIVEMAASPNLHTASNIPNEDSQIAELSNINLFSPDRFTGLDALESGLRGTFGTRGQMQFANDEYFEWLLGQAYQQNQQSPFPIATSAEAHFSDYVGRLAAKYKWMELAYSFRLDRESLSPTSNEVIGSFNLKPLTVNATYISLHNEPLFGDRKAVFGDAALDLTRFWTMSVTGRKDLGSSVTTSTATTTNSSALDLLNPSAGTVGLGLNLIFHNECVMVTSGIARSYISQLDVRPSTNVSVTLVLKNFGGPDASQTPSSVTPGTEALSYKPGAPGGQNTSAIHDPSSLPVSPQPLSPSLPPSAPQHQEPLFESPPVIGTPAAGTGG